MKNLKDLKIALVHDFLVNYGGAERVLETLSEMFPEAPIFTLLYDKEKMGDKFQGRDIRTSFLQSFPRFLRSRYRWLLPLLPMAPETFDFREYDLVISSSGAWSKGIVTKLSTTHIAYIHSPMRFVWDANEKYSNEERGRVPSFPIRVFFSYLRLWDKLAADRPDFLIANSKFTQKRIAKYYRRDSQVIYPPVNFEFPILNFESNPNFQNSKFFLVVSRLSSYKNTDKIIEAFNDLGLPLVVVGTGRQEENLRKIAKDNVKILGWQTEEELLKIYAGARAFVFASLDDFGLSPVEAMSQGVPVVALRKGGALEYVEEGKNGEFFREPSVEEIKGGVEKFLKNEGKYDIEYIKESASKFSKERFKEEIRAFLEEKLLKTNS